MWVLLYFFSAFCQSNKIISVIIFLNKTNLFTLQIILMETILFQICKKFMFLKLIQNLTHGFNIWLAGVFDIDQNIVQIYDNKNVNFLSKNLVNVALKASWSIKKSKKQDLVLKMSISDLKDSLLFVTFSNSH